jgi:hypothetical protein
MFEWNGASYFEKKSFLAFQILFRTHPNLLEFIFERTKPRIRKLPEILIQEAQSFSSAEYILVRVALDLWSGNGNVTIWEVYETLDDSNFENFISCLQHLGPKFSKGAESYHQIFGSNNF